MYILEGIVKNCGFILQDNLLKILEANNIIELTDEDYNYILNNLIIIKSESDYPFYIPYFVEHTEFYDIFFNTFVEFLIKTNEYKYFVNKMIKKFKYLCLSQDGFVYFKEEVSQEVNYLIILKGKTYVPSKQLNTTNYILSFILYIGIYETFLKRRLIYNQANGVNIPTYRIERLYQLKNRIYHSLAAKKKFVDNEGLIKITINYLIKTKKIKKSEAQEYLDIFNYILIHYDNEATPNLI